MLFEIPDDTLAEDHRARLFWRVLETLDLSAFTAGAKAVEGHQGRPLASVHMLAHPLALRHLHRRRERAPDCAADQG